MDHSQAFRHSGWEPIRRRIRHAMFSTEQTAARITAFDDCGKGAWLMVDQNDPNRYKLQASYCHDRLCTPCANARSAVIRDCLKSLMASYGIRGELAARAEVVHAPSVVTMEDKATSILKDKKDSSIRIAAQLVRDGHLTRAPLLPHVP